MSRPDDLATRKQMLIAQAEFDRLKLAMTLHDLRRIVRPGVATSRRPAAHSTASRLLGLAMPVFGASRAGRVIRALSIALSMYRFLRSWSGRH